MPRPAVTMGNGRGRYSGGTRLRSTSCGRKPPAGDGARENKAGFPPEYDRRHVGHQPPEVYQRPARASSNRAGAFRALRELMVPLREDIVRPVILIRVWTK